MAILGQGILPAGAAGNELLAVTRRAFIPKLVVQTYKATPTLSALLAAADPIQGGVSPITQPVQGAAMVTTQKTDYAGAFNAPQVQAGIQNAEFNLRAYVTPIPFYAMEGLGQEGAAVIPLMEARMNDAGNSIVEALSTDLWTASSSDLALWSIPDVINSTNPARGNYGGINRVTYTFWKGKETIESSVTPTRANVLKYIAGSQHNSGGEMPKLGITSLATWALLAQDYVGQERYVVSSEGAYGSVTNGPNAAFTALNVAGVPIYADPYCPDGTLVLLNTDYFGFKIHQDAAFAVAGPDSMLPNMQLASIMVLVVLLELVSSKPKALHKVTGLTYLTL
jgi:hypothetical protein